MATVNGVGGTHVLSFAARSSFNLLASSLRGVGGTVVSSSVWARGTTVLGVASHKSAVLRLREGSTHSAVVRSSISLRCSLSLS